MARKSLISTKRRTADAPRPIGKGGDWQGASPIVLVVVLVLDSWWWGGFEDEDENEVTSPTTLTARAN